MNQLFNGVTFGIGFAIGNRIVDFYKDEVDTIINKFDDYLKSTTGFGKTKWFGILRLRIIKVWKRNEIV